MIDEKVKESFLAQFPQSKRATIMNTFLGAIRDGVSDSGDIIEWVINDSLRRMKSQWANDVTKDTFRKLIGVCSSGNAFEMVRYCLWWESLTSDEKQKIRRVKGTDYAKQVMAMQEPTEKQLKYLKALGCNDIPISKAQTSDWIERFKDS